MANRSTPTIIRGSLVVSVLVIVGYMAIKWQSPKRSEDTSENASKENRPNQQGSETLATVSRIEFLTSVFKDIKPPSKVARIVLSKANEVQKDSLLYTLNWSQETNNPALTTLIKSDLYEFHNEGKLEDIARESIFLAASQIQESTQRSFLFQQGKRWIEKGLSMNSESMPLRNALIIYQSEYLNQPMAFLKTLRASQKIDSNDVELNFIHLNLLKKSNQYNKAIHKCEKLVSLQPQNPYWLFEMSDLYGTMGDSTNAKVYLNLAIQRQRNQEKN